MRKNIALLLAVSMLALLLCACGSSECTQDTAEFKIVTTIFPEYDWVMNILGENSGNFSVSMLADSGVDLHSFQPAADDLVSISQCDLFIYIGGESDKWVEDAIASTGTKAVTLNLMDVLGDALKEEELIDGMQGEEDDAEEEEPEYDEHIWLSLKNASILVRAISDKISAIDENNSSVYASNAEKYIEKLNALDSEYEKTVSNASLKTLVFADRFPFRYLTDDYGLNYYAAFMGCSAESEASFETISFLASKVDELGLKYVLVIEGSDRSIADTVIASATVEGVQILPVNSMQSVTSKSIDSAPDYLSVMESNLYVIKQALS